MSWNNLGRYGYVTRSSSKFTQFSRSSLHNVITTSTTSTAVSATVGTVTASLNSPFAATYDQYNYDFDGSSGYKLSPMGIAANANFTIEFWFRLTQDLVKGGASVYLFSRRDSGAGFSPIDIVIQKETVDYNRMRMLGTSGNASWSFTGFGTKVISVNQWYHVAAVKNGTAARLYVDGVQDATGTYGSATLTLVPDYAWVGLFNNAGTYINHLKGQMTNIRWTDSAVYTAGFTPPSTPWSSIGSSLFYQPMSARGQSGVTLNT
jgi:hypothetical protein